MAAPNKVIIGIDPELKALLRSIDKSLQQIAKNGKSINFDTTITSPQPTSDANPQEEGR